MHRRIDAAFRIAEQDRHTIGRFHTDKNVWNVGDNAVKFLIGVFRIVFGPDHPDRIAMNLPDGGELKFAIEYIEKTPPILVDIFARILVKPCKIQVAGRKRRNTAKPRRKAIRKACIFKWLANKNF